MKPGVVSPDHPAWNEFAARLEGPEGCNFVETVPGDPRSIEWRCDHTHLATAVILANLRERYPDISIENSIEWYRSRGGYCDCEILFNVEDHYEAELQ